MYLPRPSYVTPEHPLARSIGLEHAQAVLEECFSTHCYVPLRPRSFGRRRAVVQQLLGEGKTVVQIARTLRVSERSIARDIAFLRRAGVQIDLPRSRKRAGK